jgi:hypothetical protein
MATITGTVNLPSGKPPAIASLRFELLTWTQSGATIPPDAVDATVQSGGGFSIDVVPATYRVSLISDVQGVTRKTVLAKAATVTASTTLATLLGV